MFTLLTGTGCLATPLSDFAIAHIVKKQIYKWSRPDGNKWKDIFLNAMRLSQIS